MNKRALISVSDKTNCVDLAKFLESKNYEIISTGGTYKHLVENGVKAINISEVTHFPEILDGRVKTLNPMIHGGILAKRDKEDHMTTLTEHNIGTIDMVVVNLYPFFENAQKELQLEELVEFIDIGGPTMLRAAAKSFFDVTVISNVEDYEIVQKELDEKGETSFETRKKLAGKVFNLTSAYDAAISTMLLQDDYPQYVNASYKKVMDLRYGENPHQKSAFYVDTIGTGTLKDMEQLHGKELSFNNIRDMDMAYKVVCEFEETTCCAVKHSTPCGVAIDSDMLTAYKKAHDCDPISIFGGIVAFNKEVNAETAEELNKIFLEIVIAPAFSKDALEILKKKKNLRIIKVNSPVADQIEYVKVDGGLLVQDVDNAFSDDIKVVTEVQPTKQQMDDMIFAQKVIKHVKSNAIVIASGQQALGVGTGETNRIWAAKQAIERAQEKQTHDLVLASDAFFPFRDVVDTAAEKGIVGIIQPGGSIRDTESIEACNEHKIPMVCTGMRHFKH
ncbi:phosphoribosylaminoimidazolecarboxamide formyltransferase [Flavobacteriaceae bacterium UJ101]|nr:phosphoribosylaminoimidazolecarboxamide formyltransferase [Flavobacteriaceae bacterium UJ101]